MGSTLARTDSERTSAINETTALSESQTTESNSEETGSERSVTEDTPIEDATTEDANTEETSAEDANTEEVNKTAEAATAEEGRKEENTTDEEIMEEVAAEGTVEEEADPEEIFPEEADSEVAKPQESITEEATTDEATPQDDVKGEDSTEGGNTKEMTPENTVEEEAKHEEGVSGEGDSEVAKPQVSITEETITGEPSVEADAGVAAFLGNVTEDASDSNLEEKEETAPSTLTSSVDPGDPYASVKREIEEALACSNNPSSEKATSYFCRAAGFASPNDTAVNADDTTSNDQQDVDPVLYLKLWERARNRFNMSGPVLHHILSDARKHNATLLGQEVDVWIPSHEGHLLQLSNEINKGDYGLANLKHYDLVGPGKVFVDVGSNLGLVVITVALLYPGTRILSIEAATPTWLLQEVNLLENIRNRTVLEEDIHRFPMGLGSDNESTFQLKWGLRSTILMRAWDADYSGGTSIVIKVQVRTLRSLLQETFTDIPKVDVLKLDCEGCEYNVVPDFSNEEWEAFGNVVGEIHFGFIPTANAPSSKRSAETHKRLCQHIDFARVAKECCAFPALQVKSLGNDTNISTVAQVAGSLCDDFEKWSNANQLFKISNDTAWLAAGKE